MASYEYRQNKTSGVWRVIVRRKGVNLCKTFAAKEDAEEWGERMERGLLRNGVLLGRRVKQQNKPRNKNQLLPKEAIIAMAETLRFYCGIYFLIYKDEVVYIGQSKNILERVSRHIREGKKSFDRFTYIEEHPHRLDAVETQYIELLRPKFNFDEYGILQTPAASMERNLRRGNVLASERREKLVHPALEVVAVE